MFDEIKGREIAVIGLGRSGAAAVRLLAGLGAGKIVAADNKPGRELEGELEQLRKISTLEVVTGGIPPGLIHRNISFIIKSPGVPPDLAVLRRAREMQVPVLSEIELAYHFIKAPLIGITGSNGKSTTTVLTAEILKEARFNQVVAAGNIGPPLSEAAGKVDPSGVVVAELSSFQLTDIRQFRPTVAVFLNFEEDHLDYHGNLESYFMAKARILENQNEGDYAVLNAGDEKVASLRGAARGSVVWFGREPVRAGAGLEKGRITLYNDREEGQVICHRDDLAMPGEHNLENALAAAAAAWTLGADAGAISRTLKRFKGLEHRLEYVTALDGVKYINDSKGTNPSAAIKALQSFPGKSNIILIAGGMDKGSDFSALARVIKEKVKFLVLLGQTGDKLARAAEEAGFGQFKITGGLEEAVTVARARARSGDLVLLSPACTSWDMFANFEDRGDLFKKLVRSLHS